MLSLVHGADTSTMEVGCELASVAFVKPSTVAAWSTDGKLSRCLGKLTTGEVFLIDVESKSILPANFSKPVLAIHPAPPSVR